MRRMRQPEHGSKMVSLFYNRSITGAERGFLLRGLLRTISRAERSKGWVLETPCTAPVQMAVKVTQNVVQNLNTEEYAMSNFLELAKLRFNRPVAGYGRWE